MAMAKDSFISDWKNTLDQIQKVLSGKVGSFGKKASIALDLLEVSLDSLAHLGLLTKANVEVSGCTNEGKHIVHNYSLGSKESDNEDEEVTFIKKSFLEEDE